MRRRMPREAVAFPFEARPLIAVLAFTAATEPAFPLAPALAAATAHARGGTPHNTLQARRVQPPRDEERDAPAIATRIQELPDDDRIAP